MRARSMVALLVAGLGAAGPARSADSEERRVYVTRRAEVAPVMDGRLDDPAWATVEWTGDFVQREPADGKPPSQKTQFKVVYDDHALYLGFRAFDDPREVRSLLARRDRFPGDWIEVNLDSYFDHRTAFSFTLPIREHP